MTLDHGMNTRTAYTFYACHALSTWNARSYEFAAAIFTAAAYPGGLRAASILGITTNIAAILFASSLGRWIDNAPSRLRTLITTIAINRSTIITACLFWFLIVGDSYKKAILDGGLDGGLKTLVFLVILFLGVVENLSRKANVLSLERDWVPVLSPPVSAGTSSQYDLAHVNAIMSRIDIGCKLVAPIAVSGFSSAVSTRTSVATTAFVNLASCFLEIWTAQKVWEASSCLHKSNESQSGPIHEGPTYRNASDHNPFSRIIRSGAVIAHWWHEYIHSFQIYFSTGVWRASLAMTMTQPSILSVTGVMVVFLLNSGYSLKAVTIAEAISAVFELSSTFVTPYAIGRMAAHAAPRVEVEMFQEAGEEEEYAKMFKEDAEPIKIAVTNVGFWAILSMLVAIIPALPVIVYLTSVLPYPILPGPENTTFHTHIFASIILIFGLAASRLSRGTFSLTTQQLSQSQVPVLQRSSFGGTEQVFVSVFGLSHNIGSAIFSAPHEFGWLAFGSVTAICASVLMFVWWMYDEGIGIARWSLWSKMIGYQAVTVEDVDEHNCHR